MMASFDPQNMPQHVAIIMDGNGRWAKQQGKLRVFGHQNGVKAVRSAVSFAAKYGIKVLTLYAFSSENWSRPETEVSALMTLFMTALNSEVKKLYKNNIQLKVIGDTSRFSESLQKKIRESEELTSQNTGLILNVAANYGGYWDIIRTSGEQRISNFLLWQIAYAELFFTPVLWPDFDDNVFGEAIIAYQKRTRRFGGC